jgi:serine/threonine protein kinase
MAEPDLREAPPLGAVVGGYELVAYLGSGGMGAVYEAVQGSSRVALKILRTATLAAQGLEAVERFKREVVLSQTLESPHLVPTIDAGMDDELGLPFLVMPLLVGLDLQQLVDRIGPLHPTVAARVLRQACRAVALAHDAAVIHRDLKSANLFLDHDPDGGVTVRVLDFGIAKWLEDEAAITRTGSLLGTPAFMSPEQIGDPKSVDARSDVWGLGVTLYQMLSGHVPFESIRSVARICVAISHEDTKPLLQELAPWVDPGLALVVHGTLIRKRDQRCPGVGELMSALEPFTGGSDDIRAGELVPLGPELRGARAEVIERPSSWHTVSPPARAPEPASADRDPLLGKTLAGRYLLLRCLGRGGMGAVYEARGAEDRRLAVKVIRPELAGTSPSARRRFVRETKVVQRIESPHVVRIIEVDSDPEHELPFLAMELLHGSDLETVIRQRGALLPGTVARLFAQACSGLDAVHASGFVHRDVKPANLFLHAQPSGDVVVKVCDFGIVKQLDAGDGDTTADTGGLTRTGAMLGSPMYMSPEQATNAKELDEKSDVWSVGIALYEALSGTTPWHGRASVGEVVLAVCTQTVPHLQDRAPWVPPALTDIVHRTLRRDPHARFQSMSELRQALLDFAGGDARVRLQDLVSVSDTQRREPAARARSVPRDAPPSSDDIAEAATVPHSASVASTVPDVDGVASTLLDDGVRGRRGRWLVVAAAALAGGGVWLGMRHPATPEAAPPPASPSEAAPAPRQEPTVVTGAQSEPPPPLATASASPAPPRLVGPPAPRTASPSASVAAAPPPSATTLPSVRPRDKW